MLTKEDLQAIAAIMDEKITASEERMVGRMDSAIVASEERTNGKFAAIDKKFAAMDAKMDLMYMSLKEDISTSERETRAYIKNTVQKDMKFLMEGHRALNEKLDRVLDRVKLAENFEPRLFAVEQLTKEDHADIAELKQAQA